MPDVYRGPLSHFVREGLSTKGRTSFFIAVLGHEDRSFSQPQRSQSILTKSGITNSSVILKADGDNANVAQGQAFKQEMKIDSQSPSLRPVAHYTQYDQAQKHESRIWDQSFKNSFTPTTHCLTACVTDSFRYWFCLHIGASLYAP